MNTPDKHRKVLGKGLSALISQTKAANTPVQTAPAEARDHKGEAFTVSVSQIDPNPLQPRSVFDAAKLQELAQSIQANGVIQPLIVRKKDDSRFELIAGERRLRAASIAGLTNVPVIVHEYANDRLLEIALIENIQREDLNPIETAQALDRLARELNLSHEEIGRRTGKDRTTITNLLRLLRLPHDIQLLIAERRLSMGHARAILGLADETAQLELANKAAAQGYSVRQVERIVQKASANRDQAAPEDDKPALDPNIKAAINELESTLGTRVRITEKSDRAGKIEIEYYSQEDLHRIYEHIVSR